MSLTERYIYAVTKQLPQSQREDVAKELRASIEDMAGDRAKNGKPTEDDIKEVLIELGDPTTLAQNYRHTNRYLLGPKWYDAYIALLKQLLLIVPPIVIAVMLVVNFMNNDGTHTVATMIINAIGSGIGAGIQIAFWVTLTFVILERTNAMYPQELNELKELKDKNKPWTPDMLPFPPKARQVNLVETVTAVGLMVLAIAWVALSPLWNIREDHTLFDPSLAAFWAPLFFVLAGLATIHKAFLAKIGNWTTSLMVTNVLLGIASIAFVIGLIISSPVINPAFLGTLPVHNDVTPEQLTEWSRWVVGMTAVAFIATYLWEMADSIIKNRQFCKK